MKASIKTILLRAQKQTHGDMLGNLVTRLHGEGFEFSELRDYSYGDDIRKIDWKSTAKRQKPYVKVYNEERELNIAVAVMVDGGLYFGTHKQKIQTALETVATVGLSAVANSDRFGYFYFDEAMLAWGAPSKKKLSLYRALDELEEIELVGRRCDYAKAVEELKKRLKRGTFLFLIGDFIGEVDLTHLALKHDIFVVVVRDRLEEEPHKLGSVALSDLGTLRSFDAATSAQLLSEHQRFIEQNDKRLFTHLKKIGARGCKIYTDEDVALRLQGAMR